MLIFGNVTAHGVTYLYPEIPPSDLVWTDPKGHVNYWCSVQGDTSGSSSSPRTESRQTKLNSSESYNWTVDGNVHAMSGSVRLELVPSSGKVIVGQIHASAAPNPFLMVTWWNGVARIDMRTSPTGTATKVLSFPCELGAVFDYELTVDSWGTLHMFLNGLTKAVQIDPAWNAYPFYFKAGAYVIDNVGPETEGGWVVYEHFDVI